MTYNETSLQAAKTIGDLFTWANTASGGILIGMFMIAIFFVMLIILKRYGFAEALVSSGFVCFILSGILSYAGFLNILFPLFFLAVTAFTGLFLYMTKK